MKITLPIQQTSARNFSSDKIRLLDIVVKERRKKR